MDPPKQINEKLIKRERGGVNSYGQLDRKISVFTVRLTIRVATPPPLQSAFGEHIFGVFLTLDYDYVCSEKHFTQQKGHFQPTFRSPKSGIFGQKTLYVAPFIYF